MFHKRGKKSYGWVNNDLSHDPENQWPWVTTRLWWRYQQFLISIQLSSFAMHPPMIELMFVFTKQQTNKHNLPSQPTWKINRIWQLNPWPVSPLLKEGINISLAMGNWLCDTFNNIALVLKPSEFAL